MSKFSSTEIDALLDRKATQPDAADIPDGFFDAMEARILAATATERSATTTIAMKPRTTRRRWWTVAAAAAVLLIAVGGAVRYTHRIMDIADDTYDVYAVTDDMTDDDIDDLNDLYEADLFLTQFDR